MLMLISLLILCKLSIMEGRTLWAQRWVQTRGDYTLHNSEKPVPLSAYLYVPTPVVTPLLAQVLAHVPTPLLPQVLAHLSPPSVVTVL